MKPFDPYGVSPQLEKEGIKVHFGEMQLPSGGKGQLWIKIRRAGGSNRQFAQRMEAKAKPYEFKIRQGTLPSEIDEQLTRETYAETIVVDWSWYDENGQPLECTVENIVALFEASPDVYAEIRTQSTMAANFRAERQSEDEKKPEPGPIGVVNGGMQNQS